MARSKTPVLDALRRDGVTVSTEGQVAATRKLSGRPYVACIIAKRKGQSWAYKLALAPGLGERREHVAEEVARRLQDGPEDWQLRSDGMRQTWLTETEIDPWITGEEK